MVNLGDLTNNPELLEQEAEKFANMCEEMINEKEEPWDQGPNAITSAEQFAEILGGIGRRPAEEYKRFLEIGKEDF